MLPIPMFFQAAAAPAAGGGGADIFMQMLPLVLIVVVLLLMFGGKKIPELMRGLGQGMKEFKNAKDGLNDDKKEEGK